MTNKSLVNVGTGNLFKVPSLLGVGARAPYMQRRLRADARGSLRRLDSQPATAVRRTVTPRRSTPARSTT